MRILGESDRTASNKLTGEVNQKIITSLGDAPATFKELKDSTRLKANELAVGLNRMLQKNEVRFGFERIRDKRSGRVKKITVWSRDSKPNSNPQTT